MRHDPKSLLDRLDEPVALAVERDRIARWELFRAREEEVGDLPSRRGCVLLSVPYWDCQQPYSDSHRPFPILGTIIWIIGALVSIISILIRIINTLIRIIGPLIRIVGPLIRINGALIRILGTLIRIIGTLIRIIGTLIRIIGTVNGRLHGADWSVNLDHGIGPRQFDVYPGIDRIAFSSACPRPTQDRPKAGSAPLSRSTRSR